MESRGEVSRAVGTGRGYLQDDPFVLKLVGAQEERACLRRELSSFAGDEREDRSFRRGAVEATEAH